MTTHGSIAGASRACLHFFAATPQLALFFLRFGKGIFLHSRSACVHRPGETITHLCQCQGRRARLNYAFRATTPPVPARTRASRHRVPDAQPFLRPGPRRRLGRPRNTHAASRRHLDTEHRVDRRAVRSALQGPVAGGATDPSVDDRNRDGCACGAPATRRRGGSCGLPQAGSWTRYRADDVLGIVHWGRLRICMRASCPFGSAMSRHGLRTAHQSMQPQ